MTIMLALAGAVLLVGGCLFYVASRIFGGDGSSFGGGYYHVKRSRPQEALFLGAALTGLALIVWAAA